MINPVTPWASSTAASWHSRSSGSLSISSSAASHDTATQMSIETSATSVATASYSDSVNICGASRGASGSPVKFLTLRFTDPNRRQLAPVDPKPTARLVGRGGQGSRPRDVSVITDDVKPTPLAIGQPETGVSAIKRSDPTRIVGRGGIGSRPRGLSAPPPAPARVEIPPPMLPPPAAVPKQAPTQPVLYRPGGRGSAGLRPRQAKPVTEATDKGKSSWKGKGKQIADASTSAPPSLTVDSTASSIFLPPTSAPGVHPVYPSNMGGRAQTTTISSHGSTPRVSTDESRQRGATRLNKLIRRLGVSAAVAAEPPRGFIRTPKALRRASVSSVANAESVSPIADKYMRRRSSCDYIAAAENFHVNGPLMHNPSTYDPRAAAHMRLIGASASAVDLETPQYPAPPRPPPALPDEAGNDEDSRSPMLSSDEVTTEDNSDLVTLSSTNSAALHSNTPLSEYDTDEDHYGRSPTPATMMDSSLYSRADTSFSSSSNEKNKHFSTPFQRAPLIVNEAWEPADSVEAAIRNELAQGWIGEWNRGNIQDVISSLRELRL
ncbi:hypothetical protein FB451DRAFT_1174701 [Mycena latifolia]|nr:hypothetical protein FB451DRAFT_1174701 [Mycena latifolia]